MLEALGCQMVKNHCRIPAQLLQGQLGEMALPNPALSDEPRDSSVASIQRRSPVMQLQITCKQTATSRAFRIRGSSAESWTALI